MNDKLNTLGKELGLSEPDVCRLAFAEFIEKRLSILREVQECQKKLSKLIFNHYWRFIMRGGSFDDFSFLLSDLQSINKIHTVGMNLL